MAEPSPTCPACVPRRGLLVSAAGVGCKETTRKGRAETACYKETQLPSHILTMLGGKHAWEGKNRNPAALHFVALESASNLFLPFHQRLVKRAALLTALLLSEES